MKRIPSIFCALIVTALSASCGKHQPELHRPFIKKFEKRDVSWGISSVDFALYIKGRKIDQPAVVTLYVPTYFSPSGLDSGFTAEPWTMDYKIFMMASINVAFNYISKGELPQYAKINSVLTEERINSKRDIFDRLDVMWWSESPLAIRDAFDVIVLEVEPAVGNTVPQRWIILDADTWPACWSRVDQRYQLSKHLR